MELPQVKDLENLKGKRVLVRVDFNVPLGANGVVDEIEAYRIKKALPTIEHLSREGARVVLVSHIGRDPSESLRPVADYINKTTNFEIGFIPQLVEVRVSDIINDMAEGAIILLENLRSHSGETENDPAFAKKLAELGDLYVNEAFPVSHREHASIVSLPKFLPAYAGFQFSKEVHNLGRARDPEQPALVVLGGVKFKTKLPLLKEFLPKVDRAFVGGALANTFLKKRGISVGSSAIDEETDITGILHNEKIVLPVDVITDREDQAKDACDITNGESIVDMGPGSVKAFRELAGHAHSILWNGPMGYYEAGYSKGTKELAKIIADSHATSVVGGGDTMTAIAELGLEDKFTFVSTAGGAMLDFLADGTLPGIEALRKGK